MVAKAFPATPPPYYKIRNLRGEDVKGSFYKPELQQVVKSNNVYKIESILKKRKCNKPLTPGYMSEILCVMPNLWSAESDLALFLCQIAAVYTVIAFSLYNLTQGVENKELWVRLLSSSVEYILLVPILIKKHVSSSPSNSLMSVFPENKTSDFKVHLPKSESGRFLGMWLN